MCRLMTVLCIPAVLLACRGAAKSVPVVVGVEWEKGQNGTYTFQVTLRHDDTGWDHYADRWVVESLDGDELARRVLRHPHVDEQPFTRSLAGVQLPPGIEQVIVRGHCSQHGYGPPYRVTLSST